jgi:hypothetical protein
MKTKEEILRTKLSKEFCEYNEPFYKESVVIVAMEEYASQFQQPKKETKTIQERESDFVIDVSYYQNEYSQMDMQNFISYWTEIGDNQKKMRFEKEKVFDIKKRLERWKRNQKNFNNGKPEKRSTESAAHSFITE